MLVYLGKRGGKLVEKDFQVFYMFDTHNPDGIHPYKINKRKKRKALHKG